MPNSVERSKTVFVGREIEINQLKSYLFKTQNGKNPKFFLIEGDFGVGKTALVENFLENLNEKDVIIGKCKCSMETERSGLAPFIQLLSSIGSQNNQKVLAGNLIKFVKETAPAWLDVITGGVFGATAKTVLEGEKLLGYHSFSQENIFVQFTNAIGRITKKNTLVCFIDDLHWADTSSLSLLFHLSRNLSGKALFICTYRPVDANLGINSSLWLEISTNLIRHGAFKMEMAEGIRVSDYIQKRYPINNIPQNISDRIQKLTDGHVLFVSELFSLWEHQGVITNKLAKDNKAVWELSESADVTLKIPNAVGDVLKQRIELMESELRDTLVCGSVIGDEFTAQVVRKVYELNEMQLFDDLAALENRYKLIRELGQKELATIVLDFYQFAHPFYREHIYAHMNTGKKRILHQHVGEALESLYEDKYPIAGQLALHFREAKQLKKAAEYAVMAVKYEQSRSAWIEGEQWCEEGLKIINLMPQNIETQLKRIELLEQSGYGLINVSKFAEAEKRYSSIVDLVASQLVADEEYLAQIYYMLANISRYEGKPGDAKRFVALARDILSQNSVPFGKIHLDLAIIDAIFHVKHGAPINAIPLLNKILLEADKLPQTPALEYTRAEIHNSLGMAYEYLGKYQASIASFKEASQIAKRMANLSMVSTFLLNVADDYFLMGELEKSIEYVDEAFQLARQIGNLDNEAYAQTIRGTVFLELNKPKEALNELTDALAISKHVGSAWNMPYIYSNLARVNIALSNISSAYRLARLGVTYAKKIGFELSYALDVLGQVEFSRHNSKAALLHYQDAIELASQTGRVHYVARAQLHLAQTLLNQLEQEKGVQILKSAIENFEKMEAKNELKKAQDLLQQTELL